MRSIDFEPPSHYQPNMNSKLTTRRILLSLAVCAFLPQAVQGGGLGLYEIGTPDVGLASAGYAARAQDASTLFKNPAGMSLLDSSQMQAGLQMLYGSVNYSQNAGVSRPFQGNNGGGNAIGALPGASFFLVYKVNDNLAVGLGTFSYFGLAENYSGDWVGRYYVKNATLLGMSIMPSASYKFNDWLSVGAGLNAMFGYLNDEVAVNTGTPIDGQMRVRDEAWGFGANVGVLVSPRPGTRIGATYLSPVKLDFSDRPEFSNLGTYALGKPAFLFPPSLNLGLTVPQSVMLGIYQELNDQWAVMADVGWQNWSHFGRADVSVGPGALGGITTQLNYDDTWHGALGAEYKLNQDWLLTGGVAYDSSAVSDANRTVTIPMGEAYRFGLGAIYHWSQRLDIGAAYEFVWAGDMPINQTSSNRGNLVGGYDNAWFSFFTLNMTWRF